MQKNQVTKVQYIRIENDSRKLKDELIATESSLVLIINGKQEISFSYSMGNEEELVIGHLLSSGRIRNRNEVNSIEFVDSNCYVLLSSPIGIDQENRSTALSKVLFSKIQEAREYLTRHQIHHKATRGFHGAIIYDLPSSQWFVCEDIGRHNAVDKVIGYSSEKGYSLPDSLLLISGRLTSDLVQKGVNVGIPIIASMTVATNKGIEVARKSDTTLIGSLSETECWLYHEGVLKLDVT